MVRIIVDCANIGLGDDERDPETGLEPTGVVVCGTTVLAGLEWIGVCPHRGWSLDQGHPDSIHRMRGFFLYWLEQVETGRPRMMDAGFFITSFSLLPDPSVLAA